LNNLDPTLLKIFAAEQTEHVARIRELTELLRNSSIESGRPLFDELLRRAHTLKGAARAVGLLDTERIAHSIEDIFVSLRDGSALPDAGVAGTVQQGLDRAEDILSAALGQQSEFEARHAGSTEPMPEQAVSDDLVRVDAGTLDAVIKASSGLVMAAATEVATLGTMRTYTAELEEMAQEYNRLRHTAAGYLQRHSIDPALAPVAECLAFVDARLAALRAGARKAVQAQVRSSWSLRQRVGELHRNASRARMTPAATVFGAFGAMVRELANQEGKQLEFRSEGLHVQADRIVLQSLKDPVMHLLRNAIVHGIESPAERIAAGKAASGSIRLLVRSHGDRLDLAVEDDGRGLNVGSLKRIAVERGVSTADTGESVTPEELTALVFAPGVSTSASVTQLSGRGMGLSVVKQAAADLRGSVDLRPREGGGVVVSLSLPLSISTQHVLLVSQSGHTFAFATADVASVQRTSIGDIVRINGRDSILVDSESLPLFRLSDILDLEANGRVGSSGRTVHVVLVSVRGMRAAIGVERILEDRHAIIKETGLAHGDNGLSIGAIPLEDGTVAVLLNVPAMLQTFLRGELPSSSFIPPAEEVKKHRILVVDDSITTRSVERNILEAHGYDVELAVDGLEALDKIRANPPDLVISDVAMPRMDGFELLENIKSGAQTAHIPVILVTSLEAREEQERGLNLGADAYIVKRKFDQRDLLLAVRQIL
jgi:two-component system, chemotaxis family, sensor kinase CheA